MRQGLFENGYYGSDEKAYYPKEGVRFMEALKHEFCGFMISATDVPEET